MGICVMLVDSNDAIAKGLAMLRNGHGCEVLYYSAIMSVSDHYIDDSTIGGRELAMIVADILTRDPKSRVAGVAFGKY